VVNSTFLVIRCNKRVHPVTTGGRRNRPRTGVLSRATPSANGLDMKGSGGDSTVSNREGGGVQAQENFPSSVGAREAKNPTVGKTGRR